MGRLQIKDNRLKMFALLLMLLTAVTGYAQNTVTVTGKVTDTKGEPMIGATVKVPGEGAGVVTDIDGNFSIEVSKKAKTVVVNYVGYKTQAVALQGSNPLSIKLREDSNLLDEVVAIGYGAVKKSDVTAAIASVNAEELEDRPVSNVANALQGELAGVEVRSSTGAPGGEVQITVRGAASINEEMPAYPLYVVDGVPMDDNFDLGMLNMADIQSIDVLKDASSSAIYGSRGANGVVIITSKKPKSTGKTDIQFRASFGLQTPEKRIDNMSPTEWIAWRQKYIDSRYVAQYGAQGATAADDFYTRLKYVGSFNTNYMGDPRWTMPGYGGLALIDWQDEMYSTAIFQNYNISASGGYTRGNYRISVGYTNHDGMVVNSNFKKLNAQMSGELKLNDFITVGMRLAPSVSWKDGAEVDGKDSGIATASWRTTPVAEAEAGIHSGAQPYSNYTYGAGVSPYARMEETKRLREAFSMQSSAYVNVDILKGLQAQVLGSWGYTDNKSRGFTPSTVDSSWASYDVGYRSTAAWTGTSQHKFMVQALLTYNKKWGKHGLNAVAGWSLESTSYGYTYQLNAKQFPNNNIYGFNLTDEVLTNATATYNTSARMISYFGRVQYNYDNRYLLNASLRTDGNSRFGSNRRWATFPAVSASWRVSNEKFWPKNKVVTDVKVRVSYGQNGSCALPITAARSLMESSNYAYGETMYNGFAPTQAESPDLTWQKTHSWNFGIDLGLWRNRLSLAVDFYHKTITDMLFNQTIPSVVGYQKSYTNAGDIATNGVELELRSNNLTGRLKWTTIFNMTYMKNEVKSLGENSAYYTGRWNAQVIEVGHPIGEYYLYEAIGVYKDAEDLANSPHRETSVVGSTKYRDISGPNGVPDGVIDDYDRTYMGSPRPKFMFGMTNKFQWKDFDLSILVTAQTGGKIFNSGGRSFDTAVSASSGYAYNAYKKYQNMWFSEQDPGDGQTPGFVGEADPDASSRFLYSSDFIKIKNITLGYNVPLPENRYVSKLRATFSVENVCMWDSYDAGYSPEANNDNILGSSDFGSYPLPRTFTLGVNVTF